MIPAGHYGHVEALIHPWWLRPPAPPPVKRAVQSATPSHPAPPGRQLRHPTPRPDTAEQAERDLWAFWRVWMAERRELRRLAAQQQEQP